MQRSLASLELGVERARIVMPRRGACATGRARYSRRGEIIGSSNEAIPEIARRAEQICIPRPGKGREGDGV